MDTLLIGMEDVWEGLLLSLIVAYTTLKNHEVGARDYWGLVLKSSTN